ncbi:MAG: cupin domain-containing protein [Bacteroidota bacterium]|nr:cupin domain-containing protein [Bacteroidota bacterium]
MENLMNLFDDSNWEDADNYPGRTKRKVLRDENGAQTILLKLPKGFKMELHSHIVAEQHFVLDGEYTSNGKVYPKGSFQMFSPHEDHGPFESKEGALVLVTWDPVK